MSDDSPDAQRIDAWLWHVRLARSRSVAKTLAGKGHVRLNGRRVTKAHQRVRIGDVLTVPRGQRIQVVQIEGLPVRRLPASEVGDYLTDLTEPIAPAMRSAPGAPR